MTDPIIADVQKLLDAEIGEKRILQQIKRAAENNEVISNYERNYVSKLVETYFKPPPPEIIIEDKSEPLQKITETKQQLAKLQEDTVPTKKPFFESKIQNQKTTKIAVGIGAIALAIILIVGVSMSGIQMTPLENSTSSSSALTIETDQSSYSKGDIISISGNSKSSLSNTINLTIENSNGELIWAEDIKIKQSGIYSTLVIAGGEGWEKAGTYTLKVVHGNLNEKITFNFKN
jgi:hypothetical protein